MKNILFAAFIVLFQSQTSFANENVVSTRASDPREQHKYGAYLGFGTPYPSLMGLNVGYNMGDVRLTAGFAELEATTSLSYDFNSGWTQETMKASSYDIGAEYYFMPGENWRPVTGVHLGYIDLSGKGNVSFNGFSKDTLHAYLNLGIDYMSSTGYQFAVGYNQGFIQNGNGGVYVNAGRFF